MLLGSTSQRILNFSSQNLDNCRVFSMISLQFSIINISLSFKGVYTISLQFLRDLREEERKRERESVLKDWSLTNSLGYFDVTLTWILSGYVFWEFER